MNIPLSVIVPVFNNRNVITALSQLSEYKNFIEVVVVDDSSSDGTTELLRNFIKSCRLWKLIELRENIGVGMARNVGLKHITGKYVTFLDSDDQLTFNGNTEKFLEWLSKSKYDVIFMPIQNHCRKNNSFNRNISHFPWQKKYLLIQELEFEKALFPRECWGHIFALDFLKKYNIEFPKIRYAEDVLFVCTVFSHMQLMTWTLHLNYIHFSSPEGLSSQFTKNRLESYIFLLKKMLFLPDLQMCKPLYNLSFDHALHSTTALAILFYKQLSKEKREEVNSLLSVYSKTRRIKKSGDISLPSIFKDIVNRIETIINKSEVRDIYLYCFTDLSLAVREVLKIMGFEISGIFDDNREHFECNIIDIKKLATSYKKDSSIVIICHPRDRTTQSITERLQYYGFNNKHILSISLSDIID